MDTIRVILAGILVWILGVCAFITSYTLPVLEDLELQSNIALAIAIIPAAWLGARVYYLKGNKTNGFLVGLFMVLVAVVLDALITVPFLIIPNGGGFSEFFTTASFWLIASEYYLIVLLYWYLRVNTTYNKSYS
ncbi:MAG: DUF5367 family protein [Flavobacteriaceae bacterium]